MVAPRSRTPLVLGIVGGIACLGLVLLLVLGGIVGYLVLKEGSETAADPGPSTPAAPGAASGAGALVAPPGVSADPPDLALGSTPPGPGGARACGWPRGPSTRSRR